jgi:hypothetical protein
MFLIYGEIFAHFLIYLEALPYENENEEERYVKLNNNKPSTLGVAE